MRFVVLLFGLLSIPFTAMLGFIFLFLGMAQPILTDLGVAEHFDFILKSPTGMPNGDTGFFLLVAAGYGFLGMILGFFRCGWQGALLLIVPVACAAIMNPLSLIMSGPQIFTGLLCFLVFPLPINPPAVDD